MKKYLPLILIILVVGAFVFSLFRSSTPSVSDDQAQLLLFWGNGCPHCEKVKDYIKSNKLDDKIKIAQKEVYYNQANQKQLEEIAKGCKGIDISQGIGVPLAFDTKTKECLLGDSPIISWLDKNK